MPSELATSEITFLALGISIALTALLALCFWVLKWTLRKWIGRKQAQTYKSPFNS